MNTKTLAAAALMIAGGTASANIAVTEIWAGGIAGAEATPDWFEITNFGATDFDLTGAFYDDDSADPTADDAILGVTTIAAGESVIILTSWEDDWATSADAISSWNAVWGVSVQVGYVDGGGGLGGGGDAVFVFDGNTAGATTLATAEYTMSTMPASFILNPVTNVFGEYAQAGVFGAFESVLPASDEPGIGPAIGSPGHAVPSPASAALIGLGGLVAARRRRA